MNLSIRQLSLLFFLVLAAPSVEADGFKYIRSESLFGESTTVEMPNGMNAFFVTNETENPDGTKSYSTFIASGQAATNLAEGFAARKRAQQGPQPDSAPDKPRILHIVDDEIIVGSVSELFPGSGIYITSRHTFSGRDPESVTGVFDNLSIHRSQRQIMEVTDFSGKPLDVILLGGKANLSDLNYFKDQASGSLSINDWYYSYQLGELNGKVVEQQSYGKIRRSYLDHVKAKIILEPSQLNFSTSGSSGSLVYFAPENNSSDWRVGAILECFIKDGTSGTGVPYKGAVQAISIYAMLNLVIQPISVNELIASEYQYSDENCLPIDRREGGGVAITPSIGDRGGSTTGDIKGGKTRWQLELEERNDR